ncbi:MAG: type II secretion system F family protein [Dehalobacter sp. 4CP]|nr:type II secretion system F family protein [Dehalobacter sp. 4CP]
MEITRALFTSVWIKYKTGNRKLFWGRTTRKLGTMLEAGIPLLSVLDVIAERETTGLHKNQWKQVSRSLQAGVELHVSLQGIIPSAGHVFYTMVKAGERSGTLPAALLDVADYLEDEYFFEKKFKNTLFYPLLLLVAALVIVYALSVLILPMYETLFRGFETELPLATKMMFKVGGCIPYLTAVIPVLAIVVWLLNKKGHSFIIPGTGKINRTRQLIQFCSVLGRLLDAGLSVQESLLLVKTFFKDRLMQELTAQLIFAVNEGRRMFPVIMTSKLFPAEAAKMLEVAEESGRLSEMLAYLTQMFKKELEERIQQYTKLLEPALVLMMAGMVGFVAIGVLLPIFDISSQIH